MQPQAAAEPAAQNSPSIPQPAPASGYTHAGRMLARDFYAVVRWHVSAQHFIYLVCPGLPGLGFLSNLLSKQRNSAVWTRLFDLHRGADLVLHLQSFLSDLRRVDHCLLFVFHSVKYWGMAHIGKWADVLNRHGDTVDCISHSISGAQDLGVLPFLLGILPGLLLRVRAVAVHIR